MVWSLAAIALGAACLAAAAWDLWRRWRPRTSLKPDLSKIRPLEVELQSGAGPIRFSMTATDVLRLLPEPRGWEEWMGGNTNGNLLYHGMVLWFWPDSNRSDDPPPTARLFRIQLRRRPGVTLFGVPAEQWTAQTLRAELEARGHAVRQLEPTDLSVGDALEFAFDSRGRLELIDLSAPGVEPREKSA